MQRPTAHDDGGEFRSIVWSRAQDITRRRHQPGCLNIVSKDIKNGEKDTLYCGGLHLKDAK